MMTKEEKDRQLEYAKHYHRVVQDRLQYRRDMGFVCCDCKNVDFMTYMVHSKLFFKHFPKGIGIICMPCFENRIGRKLRIDDFNNAPCNNQIKWLMERGKECCDCKDSCP